MEESLAQLEEATSAFANSIIKIALDEKTRGCTAVLDIQKAFAILQSGIIDREKIRIEEKQ